MDFPSHIERMVTALSSVPTRSRQEGGRVLDKMSDPTRHIDWAATGRQLALPHSPIFRKIPFNTQSWEYLQQHWPVSTNVEDRRFYDPTMNPAPLPRPRPQEAGGPPPPANPWQGLKDIFDTIPKEVLNNPPPLPPQQTQQSAWPTPPTSEQINNALSNATTVGK